MQLFCSQVTDVDISESHAYTLLNHECATEGAVEIYPHRADVDHINNKCINALPSQPLRFACKDYFSWKKSHRKTNPELKKHEVRNKDGTLKELVSRHLSHTRSRADLSSAGKTPV
jgi:hypothetical protein